MKLISKLVAVATIATLVVPAFAQTSTMKPMPKSGTKSAMMKKSVAMHKKATAMHKKATAMHQKATSMQQKAMKSGTMKKTM